MLLLSTWLQDRRQKALQWWGPAFILGGIGTGLLALRGAAPDLVTKDIANTIVILAVGCTWIGVRVFQGRSTLLWVPLLPAAAWLVLCQLPIFAEPYVKLRIATMALTLGTFMLLAAFELWRDRDCALVSRWPTIILLTAYGTLLLSRLIILQFVTLPPSAQLFQSRLSGLMALCALLFITALGFLFLALTKESTEFEHRRAAEIDPLTGLLNRRALLERGEAALQQPKRRRRPTSVLVFDLDGFKSINDRFGHPMGDHVLQVFGDVAAFELRKSDVIGRIGGEEFAAVLPDCDEEHAFEAAERIRIVFAARARLTGPLDCNASVSVGVATDTDGRGCALSTLLAEADRAVYRAKAAGRNCVRGAGGAAVMPLRNASNSTSCGPLAA